MCEKASVVPEDLSDVLACFVDRRKSAIPVDHVLSGIVGGQCEGKIPSKSIQQLTEILSPTADIIFRIVQISNVQLKRGLRHELHQPDRTGS